MALPPSPHSMQLRWTHRTLNSLILLAEVRESQQTCLFFMIKVLFYFIFSHRYNNDNTTKERESKYMSKLHNIVCNRQDKNSKDNPNQFIIKKIMLSNRCKDKLHLLVHLCTLHFTDTVVLCTFPHDLHIIHVYTTTLQCSVKLCIH